MIRKEIRPGLWFVGAVDECLRTFGPASFTEAGMMYNSYLMDTGDGWILFGTLPRRYGEEWLGQVRCVAGDTGPRWVVLLGTDHDRYAARLLLRAWPDIVLVGGVDVLFGLEGFAAPGFHRIEVRGDRRLAMGKKQLTFCALTDGFGNAPIYVLDREGGVLLTADAFGSACASPEIFASRIEDRGAYLRGAARYFADIFGRKRQKTMWAAADLVRNYGVNLICPAVGPVADGNLEELISVFLPSQPQKRELPTLAVICAPGGYGYELAEQIEAGVREAGPVAVERYDLSEVNRDEVLFGAARADAFLFGTPELREDAAKALWDVVTSLQKEDCRGKPAAVFCSTDSGGRAAENLRGRLAQLGCDLNWQDYHIRGRPDVQTLKSAWEYGFGLGCSLLRIPNPRKPRLVKCLVCGEIFDAALGVCPVCGVGLEQCVPVDEAEVAFRRDSANRYLILGGGVAAVSAAEAIRQRDGTGSILLVSAEDHLPINRPMLTKDFDAAAQGEEGLFIHASKWYSDRGIELRLGCRAVSLDVRSKTVTTDSGQTIPYDRLIYAMGAECFVPPFEGCDKPGVLTIRHLSDSRRLTKWMEMGREAVVIGGGVLGLEAASELMRSGIRVTVLEAAPQIIGRQIDAGAASILKKKMEAVGVACYEGVAISAVEGEERVTGVRLEDGRVFPADFVIVSCGNQGNVEVARQAGLAVKRAVLVDQRMATSVANVYACGDCAQFDDVNFQLWQEASEQGRVAGANAAGDRLVYANQLMGLSLEAFGTTLFAVGDPGKRTDIPYKTVETWDSVTARHEEYWFYGSSLQGAVLIGVPEKVAHISRAVKVHARYNELF